MIFAGLTVPLCANADCFTEVTLEAIGQAISILNRTVKQFPQTVPSVLVSKIKDSQVAQHLVRVFGQKKVDLGGGAGGAGGRRRGGGGGGGGGGGARGGV